MLGDACLLRFGDAGEAIEHGLRITGELARRHGFPDVRVGMHTGTAARRGTDWFGSTINMAARIAALAGPGDVLLTSVTREAATACADVVFDDHGMHELRHIARPVRVFRARGATLAQRDGHWVIDPVCHMRLDAEHAFTSVEFEGSKSYFCSATCAGKFAWAPERYLQVPRSR